MDIYCKNCKQHTGNTFPKQLVPFSKNIIKQKTFISEIEEKYDLESKVKVYPKFFTCWSCKKKWRLIGKNAERKLKTYIQRFLKQKNSRLIMQSKCNECGFKNYRFVKKQEAKGLLSNLEIKTLLSKIPLLNVLF